MESRSSTKLFAEKIRAEIPALKGFQFEIISLKDKSISVGAQLHNHINHKGTAFGGSLYQVALVAAYGLVLRVLESNGFTTRNIVISKGEISYSLPVEDDFWAEASLDTEAIATFCESLRGTERKARVDIVSDIRCQGSRCAKLKARFVAFSK